MQNPFKLSHVELKTITNRNFIRLAILTVIILPLLYGVLYLWAFWDPYGKLNNLPVAVVNEDAGYTDGSINTNYGDDLVKDLENNQVLRWDFVSQEQADNGLTNKTYYAEITIPNDFSSKIASVSGDNPQQANIIFKARESNNLIASQLISRVIAEVSKNINKEITQQYFNNIFSQIQKTGEGLQEGADGNGQLAEGLTTLQNGNKQLITGTNDLYQGSLTLTEAINCIILGNKNLSIGINDSYKGAQTLASGISQAANGSTALNTGASSLKNGVQQISVGVNQLIANMSASTNNLTIAQSYLVDPSTIITDPASPFYGMTKLQAANYIINSIISQSTSATAQAQITSLKNGINSTITGSNDLTTGISNLNDALNNQLKPGGEQLAEGLNQLNNGETTLNNGLFELSSGSNTLSSGLVRLSLGEQDLGDGITQTKNGANILTSQLSNGAQKVLANSNLLLTGEFSRIMSNPVIFTDESIAQVDNYGTGFAPYFIPLALWVGGLVLFLIIRVDGKDEKEKHISSASLIFSKYITLAKIGFCQAVVLDAILILALGLKPLNYCLFFLFSILISWTFLAILLFLISLLQDAGKFLGIVLLMLQLTSASGTYPIETSPAFFQTIHPFLPMTYAVRGLREIVSGGNYGDIYLQCYVLLGFAIVFLGLDMIIFNWTRHKKINLEV